jgi:hypothetical protein
VACHIEMCVDEYTCHKSASIMALGTSGLMYVVMKIDT